MKKMSKKDNVGRMSTNYPFNSDMTLTRPLRAYRSMVYTFAVFAMLLLGGWNTHAWAWRGARVYAKSSPSTGGTVDVSTGNANGYSASESAENSNWNLGTQSFSFKLYYSTASEYSFKGWSTSETANTGDSGNPKTISVNGTNSLSYNEYTYYAIFARLTTDADSYEFGEKDAKSGWGNAQSVKVTYVHAGTVTATISGTDADDFSFQDNALSNEKTVVSNNTNTETTTTITVYFNPQCAGKRTATLTFSGNGMTTTVTLTGMGVLKEQTLKWDNEYEENMLNGTELQISASSTSGLTVSYESSNPSVLFVTQEGDLQANGLGTAIITASQTGNCEYSAATSITKTFIVKSKDTPIFKPSGFAEGSTCNLKVGDKVTMEVEHVSAGLDGDFTATAPKANGLDVLKFTREGNIITIEAINAGNTTATFTQEENNAIVGATKDYSFSVSKHQTSFSGSDYNLMVDGEQDADYAYTNVSADEPSASSNDDFYYTIDEVVFTNSAKNKGTDLITFDPAYKRITACNAGTATITLHQKETYKYTGATKSFNVTVYKYNSVFSGVADLSVKVDANVTSGYVLTYTKPDNDYAGTANHTAGTPLLNSGDWYYTLAQNVTSTNTTGSADATKAVEYVSGTKTATGKNAGTGTIHFYQNETYKYNAADTSFVVTVTKNEPVFTWKSGPYYHNTSISDVFSSTNTDLVYTIGASTDTDVAYESGNTLYLLSKAGTTTFTVTQPENYKWKGKTETYSVTPQNPSNHVTFTYTQAMYNDGSITTNKVSEQGTAWDGGKLRLGGSSTSIREAPAYDWDDKYVIIKFEGIPDKLSFKYHTNSSSASNGVTALGKADWYIAQSVDGKSFTNVWTSTSNSSSEQTVSDVGLATGTRYLKLCYSGNFAGYFKDIKVTELKKFTTNPSSLDFGENEINASCADKTFDFNYANVGHNVTLSVDDSQFTVSPTSITNIGGEKAGTVTITVGYSTAEVHKATNAKLTITDELGNSTTITLKGETKKLEPTITWSSDASYFNVEDVLSATNANGLTVALSVEADDEAYVACRYNTATMLDAKDGTVTITAHVTGNSIYEDATFTKEITITNKTKQSIDWSQDFSRLKTTDETKSVTLNASASSGLLVTYELQGDQTGLALSQSGNVWTLTYSATECKNTTIIAKQDGNDEYAPAPDFSLPVKVIDPTKECDVNYVVINSDTKLGISSQSKNVDIPSTMTIVVKRTNTEWYAVYGQGFDVEFYSGSNGTGNKIGNTYSYHATDINTSKTIRFTNLDRAIKSVKLISNALYGYTVSSLTYTQQKYCELSTNSLSFETYPNTVSSAKTFKVDYANYPVSLECANKKFTISPTDFGDCGDHDNQTVSVTYAAGPDEGDDSGIIYIKDNTGKTLGTCTLSVSIKKLTQSITAHNIQSSYNTTDKVTLNAETNSGLSDFTFTASPSGIASINGNEMTFSQSGTIAVTVSEAGNNVYSPCSTTVSNIVVNKVTPTIVTQPTGTAVTYLQKLGSSTLSGGQATVTLRGVAGTEVDGTFAWTTGQPITDAAGSHNYSVTFTPTDLGMYNPTSFTIPVTVTRAAQSLTMKDGSVKVLIPGLNDTMDESKIDLSSLIVSKNEADHAGTVTYEVISDNKATGSISGNYFSATAGGEYTVRATQIQTDYYAAAMDEFVITVSRTDAAISNESEKTLKVEDVQENAFTLVNTKDLIPHITILSISDINNGDGQVIEYDAKNNRIIAHNAGVAEIYLEQPETGTINASNSQVYTYTVGKWDNSFTGSWDAWYKEVNFNDNVSVAVSTDNADYTHSPIVAQASAADSLIAMMSAVDATHFTMKASVNVGISTWNLSQAENYKYLAANQEIQLIVKALTAECFIFEEGKEHSFSTDIDDLSGHFVDEDKFAVNGPADKISFKARKDLIGYNYFAVQYSVNNGSTWRTIAEPDLSSTYKAFSYTFSELPGANKLQEGEKVTHIRFGANTGATLSKYYKDIKISRKAWLQATDASKSPLDTLFMPDNTIGNTTTATFYVNYSTCDDVVRMTSDNAHFTLSKADMAVAGDNDGNPTEITITYSNTQAAEDTATITLYTQYENTTFTVVGKTNKKEQFIEWQDGFRDSPLVLSLGTTSTNEHPAAKATSGVSVVYTTDNPEVIEITLGGLGFTVIGNGTANLCASEAGDATWNAVSDTITISSTGKQLQEIVWEQNFRTVDWEIGQDTTMQAKVYLRDARGNLVFSQERTDSIVYTCPENNGVISIDTTSMTILGYGKTTVTASVAGDEMYEEAKPVTLIVKVSKPSEGCVSEPVLEMDEKVVLFSMAVNLSDGASTPRLTSQVIELDPSKGKPDMLSYQHNAEAFTIGQLKFCGGTVFAQQRVNGQWIPIEGSEYTTPTPSGMYDWREVDSLQLDERADAIQFVRMDHGMGYHNFQGIQVSLKHYLRPTQTSIELGPIQIGERIERAVGIEYSDVKADLQVSKADKEDDMLTIDDNDIDTISCGGHGHHDISIVLLPSKLGEWSDSVIVTDTITKDTAIVYVKATIVPGSQYVFEKEGPWVYYDNWKDEKRPDENNTVLINANAEIREGDTIKVKSMTITEGVTVTVHGVLELGSTNSLTLATYGNLHVADGGKVMMGNGVLLVNDFILEASLNQGHSGQVTDAERLFVRGDAYFDLALDPSGECSPGWYDFTVPFPIHALQGVTRFDNSTHQEKSIVNEVNYAIMDYSENRHLETGYGWKKFRSVMQPGQCYTITIDDVDNVYRFKKTKDGAINTKTTETLACTASSSDKRGWNCLGNGTLAYANLDIYGIEKVQIYDHESNSYSVADIDKYTYAVGTAFMVQTPAEKEVSFVHIDESTMHTLRAPQRMRTIEEFRLALTAEGAERESDRLYVGASEEATDSYVIGRDLYKFGEPTEAKVAQVWAKAYGHKLCDIEMPLNGDVARCELGLYAPKESSYTLSVEEAPEDVTLYLTYNDRPVWNLSMSPYVFDLTTGTTEGYGLQLYVRPAAEVATGVDEIQGDNVPCNKVLMDGKMYIIAPDGRMYDAIGKKVK